MQRSRKKKPGDVGGNLLRSNLITATKSKYKLRHNQGKKSANNVVLKILLGCTGVYIFVVITFYSFHISTKNAAYEGSQTKSNQNDIRNLRTNKASNENKDHISQYNDGNGVSACLLIKDDNNRLIEWLAYHYQVLPLRHLIIAIDPDSETTPLPILQRWDDTHLNYIMWQDHDYISGPKMVSRRERKLKALASDDSKELAELHLERQRIFVSQCSRHYKLMNHSWVAHIDTDEYIVFNTISADDPTSTDDGPLIPNPERKYLPKVGEKTVSEVIEETKHKPCIAMFRLLYGAIEAKDTEMEMLSPYSSSFDVKKFDTLRFVRHHEIGLIEGVTLNMKDINGLGKVLVDVSQLEYDVMFPEEKIFSIHRPFFDDCPPNILGPWAHAESIFRVNHYLGSWEAYSARSDVRRKRTTFEKKANALQGPSFDIYPWLGNFVKDIGESKAEYLLEGVGEIETGKYDIATYGSQSTKSCAILFFGLGRKLKEISFPAIKEYILDANPTCDVFVHTINVTKVRGNFNNEEDDGKINPNEMYLLTDPSRILFETEAEFLRQHDLEYFRKLFPTPSAWKYPASMDSMIRQWHSISRVWAVMESHEEKRHLRYERIGLFRPDVLYTHPIHINGDGEDAVIPSMMYNATRWGGYNDRLFYGERAYAELWATTRFESVDSYMTWQGNNTEYSELHGLHSEDFMRWLLTVRWPVPLTIKKFCFQRIRSNGHILETDCDLIPKDQISMIVKSPLFKDNDIEAAPGVIVLGMHRSGTSLLTGLLSNVFSWKVPGIQISVADKNQNRKGFFESNAVARLNDFWLEEQGMYWDEINMATAGKDSKIVLGGFDPSLANTINEMGEMALSDYNDASNRPWALKDPRMCLTLSKWLSVLEGPSPPILFTYRNPLDVARSLFSRRNSVPLIEGLKLWIWYNRQAIQLSQGTCRVITSNEALIKNATKELRKYKVTWETAV